jgi:hypothetical protein
MHQILNNLYTFSLTPAALKEKHSNIRGVMMRFSKRYKLPHKQAALDFVDIDTALDLPLFSDPKVFLNEDDPFSTSCTASIKSYFATLVDAIKSKNKDEALRLLGHLSEPNEICLGWSNGKPHGRGIGPKQASRLFGELS